MVGQILSRLFNRHRYRKSWLRLFQSGIDIVPRNYKNGKRGRQIDKEYSEYSSSDESSSFKNGKCSYDDESLLSHSSGYNRKYRDRKNYRKSLRRRRRSQVRSRCDDSPDIFDDFLTIEELNELPAKVLRSRCRQFKLNTRKAIRKTDLVNTLYGYYEKKLGHLGRQDTLSSQNVSPTLKYAASAVDENEEEMRDLLQEIIPFYGQGSSESDSIVRETIDKLPLDALEIPDRFGNTILLLACQYAAFDLVTLLIQKGCDVNSQNNDGACCLHFSCYTDTLSEDILETLINNGATAEVVERQYGCTPLHWAAAAGNWFMCKLLLEAGALVTTLDFNQCSPNEYARQSGNAECIQMLSAAMTNNEESRDNKMYQNIAGEEKCETSFDMNRIGETLSNGIEVDGNKSSVCSALSNSCENSFDEGFSSSSEEAKIDMNRFKDEENFPPIGTHDVSDLDVTDHHSGYLVRPKKKSSSRATLPTEDTPSLSKNKDNFEERLAALQAKMEQQLGEQLSRLENKINYSTRPRTPGLPKHQVDDSKLVSEMTSKMLNLQNEISSRDLEIISLKRQIVVLESKIACDTTSKSRPSTSATVTDLASECKESFVNQAHRDESEALQRELNAKKDALESLESKNTELQASMTALERNLSSYEEKYERLEEQLNTAHINLVKERNAKDATISLLEQTRHGIEVDAEVAKSLNDARQRDAEEISNLQISLKAIEERSNIESAQLREEIRRKEEIIISGEKQISSLKDDFRDLSKKHDQQCNVLQDEMIQTKTILEQKLNEEQALVENLEGELKEERLLKMQKEIERNDAISKLDISNERANEAEAKLDEMETMIEEAKGLFLNNEKLHRALHVETEKRKNLHNKLEDLKGKIRVYVRIRPMSLKERERGSREVLCKEDQKMCTMLPDDEKGGSQSKSWEFDQIFGGSAHDGNSQEAIFKDTRLLVISAIDGFNVCIFAYGQTGSGKTYTMFGSEGVAVNTKSDDSLDPDAGLAPRSATELFRILKEKEASCVVDVSVTMLELHNDALRDLLIPAGVDQGKLRIKLSEHSESGLVEVDGATVEKVKSTQELLDIFKRGAKSRTTSSTKMNADSSRSHLITSIVTSVKNKRTGHIIQGKLTLVDLAGSERVGKSGATGTQLKEAQSINKSLSALGDVICSLTGGKKSHVPYRNNPLTMLMSDSIGGNAKTLMLVCSSPADYNRSESINSLDFAKRCKDVRNNVDRDNSAKVKALRVELAKMKKQALEGGTKRIVRGSGLTKRPGM